MKFIWCTLASDRQNICGFQNRKIRLFTIKNVESNIYELGEENTTHRQLVSQNSF